VTGSLRSTTIATLKVLLMLSLLDIHSLRNHQIETTNDFGRKFYVNFPSRTDWFDPESILSPNSVVYYTDGSLLNGQAGAGVYF
jgi:hypothetical protein